MVGASLAFTSLHLRRLLLPGWSAAPARLAELVLGVCLLLVVAEALGLVGIFSAGPIIVTCLLIAAATALLRRSRSAATAELEHQADSSGGSTADAAWIVAAIVAALVVVQWAIPTWYALRYGITEWDSLWYHLPFAGRFAEEGSVGALHFTSPAFTSWFYPANAEILHGTGMAITDRDLLSPLINLAFMAGALLAAWCLGRPFGAGPAALVAVAAILGAGVLADQPGSARNDIVGIFAVLSAAALLVHVCSDSGRLRPPSGALFVIGLALGLAAGVKLNLLLPVGVIFAGIVLCAAGGRARVAALLLGGILLTGGFWYARNLAQVGNPLPWLASLGPISLPGPENFETGDRVPNSIASYVTDLGVWEEFFLPNLSRQLGALWPLTVLLAVLGAVLNLVKGRTTGLRILGATALLLLVSYPFMPLSAAGPEGSPVGFASNLRYFAPALTLSLALLVIHVAQGPRWAQAATWVGLAATIPTAMVASSAWERGSLASTVALVAVLGMAAAAARWWWPPSRKLRLTAAVSVGVLAGIVGWPVQERYFQNRFVQSVPVPQLGQQAAFAWAREIHDSEIATTTMRQWPLYGADLSNHVQYIGVRGEQGSFRDVRSCEELLEALGGTSAYDYVILSRNGAGSTGLPEEDAWLRRSDAAERILSDRTTAVYRLESGIDPRVC